MMERRVEKGQCFQRPYLGCREFAAEFSSGCQRTSPIPNSMEIGRMLYDIAFLPEGNRAASLTPGFEGVMDTDPGAGSGRHEGRRRRCCNARTSASRSTPTNYLADDLNDAAWEKKPVSVAARNLQAGNFSRTQSRA